MAPTVYTVRWRASSSGVELSLDTGDWLYRDAVLFWQGREQVRDITVHPDGSIAMGPDKSR